MGNSHGKARKAQKWHRETRPCEDEDPYFAASPRNQLCPTTTTVYILSA